MHCRSVLLRVDQLRTGEIDRQEGAEVREHLEVCDTCGDTFDEVERFAKECREASSKPVRSTVDSFDRVSAGGYELWVAFSDRGLRMISRSGTEDNFREEYGDTFHRCLKRAPLPAELRQQVVDAMEGRGVAGAAVDLNGLPLFEQKVLTACSSIPHGEVRTYSWIARVIGNPKATRAVGNALNRNPVAPVVPCHRVVPAAGGVGNYALGSSRKIELLRREGVEIRLLEELAKSNIRFFGLGGEYCEPTCSRLSTASPADRVPLRNEQDARAKGFQPCGRCAPYSMTA